VNSINRQFPLLVAYILLILHEMLYLNKYVIAFGPIFLFIYAIHIYWENIQLTDYNLVLKNKDTWNTVYNFIVWSIIIQAAANKFSQSVLGLETKNYMEYMLIITPVISIICSSVLEEVIFRKMIFQYLNLKVGFWLASVSSSILFAIAHGNYAGWLGFFLLGMLWSWIYKKTGNIMVPIILHMIMNTISFIVLSIRV
jgi:membrane protease YdiL (CAAX protease family)